MRKTGVCSLAKDIVLHTTTEAAAAVQAGLEGLGARFHLGPVLTRLQQALLRPVFALYLGRKSCPLAAPLAPRIVAAPTPQEALAHIKLPPWRQGATAQRMTADDVVPAERHEQRQDQALDRQRWHFGSRRVAMLNVAISPEAAT